MLDQIRAYPMIVLLLPLVAAILLWDGVFHRPAEPSAEKQRYGFVIKSAAKPTAKCERYEVEVLGEKRWSKNETVYLYLLRDSTQTMPLYGDTVVALTRLEPYYRTKRAFAARYCLLPSAVHTVPLQVRLYNRLADAGLDGDELATTGALTLGYKEDLDPEIKRHFQASGAAHVLAVSGLHTGIIYAVLLWFLTLGGRVRPRYENQVGRCIIGLIIICFMWGYAWLTGMTPSVVRAVMMVTLVEVGHMLYRNSPMLNTIAAAAVLILLVRPSDLWSVSFQLSFAATFAIVMVADSQTSLYRYFKLAKLRNKFGKRILVWIIGTLIVSLAAQVGTLPITMYYFGQMSTYFLLANLLVLPLAALLVPLGLLTIAFGGCWLGMLTGKATRALAWAMNHATGWIEHLPGSTVSCSVNGYMIAVYYALLILFYILVIKKTA